MDNLDNSPHVAIDAMNSISIDSNASLLAEVGEFFEDDSTLLCIAKGSLQEKDGRETDNLNFSSLVEEDLKKSKLDSNKHEDNFTHYLNIVLDDEEDLEGIDSNTISTGGELMTDQMINNGENKILAQTRLQSKGITSKTMLAIETERLQTKQNGRQYTSQLYYDKTEGLVWIAFIKVYFAQNFQKYAQE